MSKIAFLSVFGILSCALLQGGDSAHPPAQEPSVETQVVHEGEKTFVWHMRGNEVVGLTVYSYAPTTQVVEKVYYPVVEKGKDQKRASENAEGVEIPPGGGYELKEGEPGKWVRRGIVDGSAEYEYVATGGKVTVVAKGEKGKPMFVRENLEPGTRVRLSDTRLLVLRPGTAQR